tara:strand:- start:15587 stop:15985 length:399 start_codon:yes stop_codon:yes gene_type:complete
MKITKRQLRRIIRETAGKTKKYDDNKALTPKQGKNLPDEVQKGIIKKAGGDLDEMPGGSFQGDDLASLKEQIRMDIRYLFEDYYEDAFENSVLQKAGSAIEGEPMVNSVVESILGLFEVYNNRIHDGEFDRG